MVVCGLGLALDSPHEATEVGGLCSGAWQTMFYVPGADGREIELDGLWFKCMCEVRSE